MSIYNREARDQYEVHAAKDTVYARATDAAVKAAMDAIRTEGLKCPNDDRIENIATAIFAMVWDFNAGRGGLR